MCEPVTIAMVAMAVVGSLAQSKAQNDAIEADNEFQTERFNQTQDNANKNFLQQAAQANLRLVQEEEAGSQQIQETNKAEAHARADATVSAGEAGVSGISVDALLADFSRSADSKNEATRRNIDFIGDQTQKDIEGFATAAANQQIKVLPNLRSGESSFVSLLKAGGAGVSAYAGAGGFDKTPSVPTSTYQTSNLRTGTRGANGIGRGRLVGRV
jgi:hypothetical protein